MERYLGGLDGLGVGQAHALAEVRQQVPGQRGPGGAGPDAVGDVSVLEGDEQRVGDVVDDEGRALLGGLQHHGHAAVGGEAEVQAEDEVLSVAERQGHALGGVCGRRGG